MQAQPTSNREPTTANAYMQDSTDKSFFAPIRSHFDALEMVADTTKAFFAIAALQFLSALLTSNPVGFIDAAINCVCAAVVRRNHSRAAAAVLLATSVLTLLSAMAAATRLFNGMAVGSIGIFLALLGLWAGWRALEATVKLKGQLSANRVAHVDDDA